MEIVTNSAKFIGYYRLFWRSIREAGVQVS
jgi:hypothetical protein